MPTDHRTALAAIKRFDQLIAYLRDEMHWPIDSDNFEELTFEYTPDELGIDTHNAAKIQNIKRLRPLTTNQPWGVFFVKFEPKRLPVVALRSILGRVALKKRASANSAERQAWDAEDLLFVSNYGEGETRQISFAHFAAPVGSLGLPTLKVLGWDDRDTALHLDYVAHELTKRLAWPEDDADADAWREQWRTAFTLRHREVITTAQDLSIHLAALARAIRDRIRAALEIETENGRITRLMGAFRKGLIHDLDADGFADMVAQTITYGLLSARIADPQQETTADLASHMRTNPLLRDLMTAFLQAGEMHSGTEIDFDELGVSEVVELLDSDSANMEAVLRDFGDRNPREDPVIHFYENFLTEYDKQKKVERGVFYTPRPVVSYIVHSVDALLRSEFGLEDGLADTATWGEMAQLNKDLKIPEGVSPDQDFVQILDPATGTGTFLVEVIDLIHKTMREKWSAQGHDEQQVKSLWNEYVPKHLLSRLYGYELLMAPYAIAHLKVGLKLYETDYRFGSDERARVYLTNALEPAHDFSGIFDFAIPALADEARAVNEVKDAQRFTVVIGNPPYANYSANLSPEARRIVDKYRNFHGVPIRERNQLQFERNIQDDFVKFVSIAQDIIGATGRGVLSYITNGTMLTSTSLRGMRDSLTRQFSSLSELNLHGGLNEILVSEEDDENVFDIAQSVAVHIYCQSKPGGSSVINYADLLGQRKSKYDSLVSRSVADTDWQAIQPDDENCSFGSQDEAENIAICRLDSLFVQYGAGIKTNRDAVVIGFDDTSLLESVRKHDGTLVEGNEVETCIRSLLYRPFDIRRIFYHKSVVASRSLPTMKHVIAGPNIGFIACSTWTTPDRFSVGISRLMVEMKTGTHDRGTTFFPLYRYDNLGGRTELAHNLTSEFIKKWCKRTRTEFVPTGKGDGETQTGPEDVLSWLFGLFHSPAYRRRYRTALSQGFPSVLLTSNLKLMREIIRLGSELIALHLMEPPKLTDIATTYVGPRNSEVGRVGWSNGTVWLDAGRINAREGQRALKPGTVGFKGVPEKVWNFHMGGYQVCHKWLKDRKGHVLSDEDIVHYQKIVIILNETIRIMGEIDEAISRHGGWPAAFQADKAESTATEVIPFRPRTVEQPRPEERYFTCVPFIPLKAAAGTFSGPQYVEEDGSTEWVTVDSRHRLREGMFVAQVIGKSMEPAIPDGAYCLFRSPVEGTRQGKTVLVQLREATDPETGQRYTVKRYESQKAEQGDSWHHTRITLKPVNPDFEPIVLTGTDEGELQVIAELVEVLGDKS